MATMQSTTVLTSGLYEDDELMSPIAHQDVNASVYRQQMTEILNNFYDSFNNTNHVLIVLYLVIIVLALVANVLVIIVVFKYHYMRSVTNYFVVNLSIADLLVTIICMPMSISQAVSVRWVYGEVMCKLFFYLQGVSVAASVFTFTAMSIDRYMAIRSPIDFRRKFNRKCTIIVIGCLWFVAFSIFIPVLQVVKLRNLSMDLSNITFASQGAYGETLEIYKPSNLYICSEDFMPLGINKGIFGVIYFVLVYAVPGFVVIVTYSMMGRTLCARKPPFDCDSVEGSASSQQGFKLVRERKRIAWILLLLASLFALCWLPYNVLRLLIDLRVVNESDFIDDVLSYCLFLGHANSAVNPIVYCFMTRSFRRSVKEILCRKRSNLLRNNPHRQTVGSGAGVCRGYNKIAGNVMLQQQRQQQQSYLGSSENNPRNQFQKRYCVRSEMNPINNNCSTPANVAVGGKGGGGAMTTIALTTGKAATATTVTNAVTQQQQQQQFLLSTSSSSGYDSNCSRHSPHRRCYPPQNSPQELRRQPKTISPINKYEIKEYDCSATSKLHRHNLNSRSNPNLLQIKQYHDDYSSNIKRNATII